MSPEDFNLYTHFQSQFAAHADKELLCTCTNESYRYADIDRQSARLANFLSKAGVNAGDRISVQVEKSPQALCLYLACLRGGFVFHPLNPAFQASELEYFLNDAEPAAIVCDPARESMMHTLAASAHVGRLYTLDADGRGSLIEQSESASDDFLTTPRERDDLAALLYSSGTTGVPKGIMLTHGNLLSNTEALVEAWGFTEHDRLLHALPIFHVHGLFVATGCVMWSGAGMRWLASYRPEQASELLPECTVMMGVPTYYTRLLAIERFTAESCKNIRVFISGSAPLLEETFVEFEARTGHRILERYGMTETNMNTSNPLRGIRKAGTVGPPLPGIEARITNDDGEVLPPNEIGNLQIRGPNVFIGYWKMPEKTAEDFTEDGFFNTGDQARIDDDGYVSIVGRARDMVITGGLNVYPKEVEGFIDDLAGVRESAVIGVPHPDFGEGVVAVIVTADGATLGEDDVILAAKKDLANYKVPKRVIFVEELPRNTMAKVQKSTLREKYGGIFS
jgi:malonyl-CoA/methylmalonyl-CoA synthetase